MLFGFYLLFFALVGSWVLLRVLLFISDRSDFLTLPPDSYLIAAWMLRLILIVLGIIVVVVAVPGGIFVFMMGDSFGSKNSYWAYATLISVGVYALSAVVLNFPFFPFALHEKLFYPTHLTLLPCILLVISPVLLLILAGLIFVYFLLWRLCLSDRRRGR